MFNMVRPLTSIIKGTFVISLTKYGRVKIFSKIHENVVVEYKPPADKTIFVDHVLPWYSNGIFFNGETLAVLYPDGTVVKKSIYLKPLKK